MRCGSPGRLACYPTRIGRPSTIASAEHDFSRGSSTRPSPGSHLHQPPPTSPTSTNLPNLHQPPPTSPTSTNLPNPHQPPPTSPTPYISSPFPTSSPASPVPRI